MVDMTLEPEETIEPVTRPDPAIRTVVLGVEGGGDDAEAMRWTAMLAGAAGARVVVVHAVPTLEGIVHDCPPFGPKPWRQELHDEIDARWCRPLATAGVDFEVRVLEEGAGHALLGTATREQADLIVIGRRAHRAFMASGSLASYLIHRASCPVVTVPPAG